MVTLSDGWIVKFRILLLWIGFFDWLECIWIAFSHFLRGTAFVIGCQNHISREINTIILINNITLFVRIYVRSWKAISGWIKPVSVTITSLVCKPPLRATRTLSFWPSVFQCRSEFVQRFCWQCTAVFDAMYKMNKYVDT